MNAPVTHKWSILALKQDRVCRLIPVVGLGSGLLTTLSILAGILAMGRLRAHWAHTTRVAPCTALPPVQSSLLSRTLGTRTPAALPPGFMLIWLYL